MGIPQEDTDASTFIRDLYMACCGHPGWKDASSADDSEEQLSEGSDDDTFDAERSDSNYGVGSTQVMPPGGESRQLSLRRKKAKLSHERRQLRGFGAACEQLLNSRIEPQRGTLAKGVPARLSHPGPAPKRRGGSKREREVLAEVLENAKLAK